MTDHDSEHWRTEARTRARLAMEELRLLRPEERLARITRGSRPPYTRALAELLLQEAQAHLPDDPAGSGVWARCAEHAARPPAGDYPDLLVLAVAYQANAHRVEGARHHAEEAFRHARRLFDRHRIDDLGVRAEVDQLQASLLIDLRRFEEAEELLSQAALTYGLLERQDRLARVLLNLSNVYTYDGRLADAIEADHAAIAALDPEVHPRLYLYARFNLCSDLVEAGHYQAARDLLAFDQDLYEAHADPATLLRVRWLEGRIALATDRQDEAERALHQARDGFVENGNGFDVASVSLDLALLYHRQHRFADLETIAASAVTLFEAQAVHRDALAALVMLRDAAIARTAAAESIHKVAAFLDDLRRNPTTRFEQPS